MLHMDFENLLNKYGKHNRNGIIHVGAHIGEEVDLYKKLGFEKVLLFEPLKIPFSQIPPSDGVYKVNCALGSTNESMRMFVASNYESSSLLVPKVHLTAHPTIKFSEEETVTVKRLDDWFIDNEFSLSSNEFSCMVLDTQGYEGRVISGAENALNSIEVIYTEISTTDMYQENTRIDYLDYRLKSYNLSRKETWVAWDGGGEAIYVKESNQ